MSALQEFAFSPATEWMKIFYTFKTEPMSEFKLSPSVAWMKDIPCVKKSFEKYESAFPSKDENSVSVEIEADRKPASLTFLGSGLKPPATVATFCQSDSVEISKTDLTSESLLKPPVTYSAADYDIWQLSTADDIIRQLSAADDNICQLSAADVNVSQPLSDQTSVSGLKPPVKLSAADDNMCQLSAANVHVSQPLSDQTSVSFLKPPVKLSAADDNVCQSDQGGNSLSQYGDSPSSQKDPVCRDESHDFVTDLHTGQNASISLSTSGYGTISEVASCVSTTSSTDNENWENAKHSLVFPFDQHAGPDDGTVIDGSESMALDEIPSLNFETSAWNPEFAQTDSSHAIVMSTILETSYQEPVVHFDSDFARMIQSKPGVLHYRRSDNGYVPMVRADHGHLFCGEFNHDFRPYGQSDHGSDHIVLAYQSCPSWDQIDNGYVPLVCYDRTYLPFSQLECVKLQCVHPVLTFGRTDHDFLSFGRSDYASPTFDGSSHDVWFDRAYPIVGRSDYEHLTSDWSGHVFLPLDRSDHDLLALGGYSSFRRSEHSYLPSVTSKLYEEFVDCTAECILLKLGLSAHQSAPNNTDKEVACFKDTAFENPPVVCAYGQQVHSEFECLQYNNSGSTFVDKEERAANCEVCNVCLTDATNPSETFSYDLLPGKSTQFQVSRLDASPGI